MSGKFDKPDDLIDGQLTFVDILDPHDKLIAISKILSRARHDMSLSEQKTFIYALTQLRFTEKPKSDFVVLDKVELAKILGIKKNHFHRDIKNAIGDLDEHSRCIFDDEEAERYVSGTIISTIDIQKDIVVIYFNKYYLPLFTNLTRDYITLWSEDIFSMTNDRTPKFYEYLREATDDRKDIQSVLLGVRAIKDMYGMTKESYMRAKGGFNRANFERFVIDSIVNDMKNCKMLKLIVQPDGKLYEKVKAGTKVIGYRFFWEFRKYVKGIPQKDEIEQKDNKGKKQKKNAFNDFQQREITKEQLDKIERNLLNKEKERR